MIEQCEMIGGDEVEWMMQSRSKKKRREGHESVADDDVDEVDDSWDE